MKATRIERGWAGHFICSDRCDFRRNTLVTFENVKIVVSTVGSMRKLHGEGFEDIGAGNRYYETMVFHADYFDTRYYDADVGREISFESPWSINELDADDRANDMHEAVVTEIIFRVEAGVIDEA